MNRGLPWVGPAAALALLLAALPPAGSVAAAGGAGPAVLTPIDAIEAAPVSAGPEAVEIRVESGPAGLEVEARCSVAAPVAIAWQVLTDYDGIDDFVSSMRESRVSGRGEHHVVVEQVAVGRLFLFRRSMRATLFVEETPQTRIRFEDVLGRDFESYHGEWRIEEQAGRVAIVYRVSARPSFSVPGFVARGLFRRTADELLSQVRTEIERRARAAAKS